MSNSQPGILAPIPPLARCLSFQLSPDEDPLAALETLAERTLGDDLVIGIGQPLALALRSEIPGLRGFTAFCGPGISIPSTQTALWCWLRGTDRGELMHAGRALEAELEPSFEVEQVLDTFLYAGGRDLTGYETRTPPQYSQARARDSTVRVSSPFSSGYTISKSSKNSHSRSGTTSSGAGAATTRNSGMRHPPHT